MSNKIKKHYSQKKNNVQMSSKAIIAELMDIAINYYSRKLHSNTIANKVSEGFKDSLESMPINMLLVVYQNKDSEDFKSYLIIIEILFSLTSVDLEGEEKELLVEMLLGSLAAINCETLRILSFSLLRNYILYLLKE